MEDLRIVKTKKTLYETLMALLKEKTFEDIKVSDICNRALINRSTFYAHYTDKYELLSSLLVAYQESLTEELNSNTEYSNPREYYLQIINIFLNHIETQKEFYKSIMINNKNSIIMDMLYDTLNADILKHIKMSSLPNKNSIPGEIISTFYSSAVINVCMEWLKSGNTYSKNQIIEYLNKLIPENPYV